MSGHRSKRVQVWVRVRPTSYFAHDMLDLHDEKVRTKRTHNIAY